MRLRHVNGECRPAPPKVFQRILSCPQGWRVPREAYRVPRTKDAEHIEKADCETQSAFISRNGVSAPLHLTRRIAPPYSIPSFFLKYCPV